MLNYAVPVVVSIANHSATFTTRTRVTRSYRLRRSGKKTGQKRLSSLKKTETIAAEYDPTGMLVDPISSPPKN